MSFDLSIVNGDFVIQNGDLNTIEDTTKLTQDILKMCLTTAGTNPIHPWYGSFLSRTIIGNAMQSSIIVQIAKSQLTTALNNLKDLQTLQTQSFQRVSADEQIAAVSNISVLQSQVDPTEYSIVISVLTKGLQPITTSFSVATI